MAQKRKLQVFVSSTYTDLKEERQAAVEAILTAGHIPAGMELFAAGDKSQMAVIERWIDESDVYLLLLGGRYGSIEPDSGKSYTHLEYDYALQSGKALFTVVIDEKFLEQKVKEQGIEVWEKENPHKLREFRSLVTGKLVKFWTDTRDIKLAIMQTLSEFDRRPELVGWIPGSEATNSGAIAEQLARLTKENSDLHEQLSKSSINATLYNGFTFEQMYALLNSETEIMNLFDLEVQSNFGEVAKVFGDDHPSLLHILFIWGRHYVNGSSVSDSVTSFGAAVPMALYEYGLLTKARDIKRTQYNFSTSGSQFYLRLRLERDVIQAREAFDKVYNASESSI